MDVRTVVVGEGLSTDWLLASPQLDTDEGLQTALLLSLFTDRRAEADDVLPDNSGNRRGWWGDSFADVPGDRFGSRLWLLSREKQLSNALQRARDYAREAVSGLVEDGVARQVEVDAEFPRAGVLAIAVTVYRPAGDARRFRFESFWSQSNAL
jgi:phage gp46-like protein